MSDDRPVPAFAAHVVMPARPVGHSLPPGETGQAPDLRAQQARQQQQ